jgi:hypothetical protein
MKKSGMTTATFRKFRESAETSSGLPIEVFYLHPLLYMTPADATEITEGSHLKLQRSMVYLRITGPAQISGRFRVYTTERAKF